ncbi:hypothetical protein HXX76_014723 [Chlamydomonas incerta]|uniref:CRAL-TRIO domain-containing protein n=1 Tax=Chlamydomonas incerta TaxID=51695 RepID=A0A835SPG6_CHLIN|nr:hypothetical protein HXX76_014723 [Chlamydomonas incerta]|eukprot:KAG2424190.1 hypothetical protein HXX76_014723 [Chlamydomonas incerta]
MAKSAVDAKSLAELKELCGQETDALLRKSGEWGLDDATLRRWLVARKGNVADAARDLKAHAVWRASYVPQGRIQEHEIRHELDQAKSFLPGTDREGRPLCVVLVARHEMKDAAASKRYIAYSLDCACAMGAKTPGWDGKMSGIFDLRGLKASNCDFATLKAVFDLLQNHYPERLHKLWLFCAPVIFYGLWKLVYPFIDPVTREKVQFVYEKDAEKDFTEGFEPCMLPPEIQPQGTGRWISVEERWKLLLAEQEAAAEANGAAAVAANDGTNGANGTNDHVAAADAQPDLPLRSVQVVA